MPIDLLSAFGTDVALANALDLALVGQTTEEFDFGAARAELIQRIVRRLFTNPGEWIPFPTYGAGLRRFVDEPLTLALAQQIKSLVREQVLQEPDVVATPPPVVEVASMSDGVFVALRLYTTSLQPVSFAFNIAAPNTFTVATIAGQAG